MKYIISSFTALICITSTSLSAFAWGRRGHSSIAVTAAYLLAQKNPDLHWLKAHSFDLGYYANIPDIGWKNPETYDVEHLQHFVDLEIFDRAFKASDEAKADAEFVPDRVKFEQLHPDINQKAGRVFWRIQEMDDRLHNLTEELKKGELKSEDRRKLQGEWLVTAGILGHYVGDLAMPLHCSENHDGQLTNQKGIHSFFEDVMVDELYPELESKILASAVRKEAKFEIAHKNKSAFEMAVELCRDSLKTSNKLLAIDKKIGRTSIEAAKKAYRSLIQERLTLGSLYLKDIWGRELGWKFDDNRFYFFAYLPNYITPTKSETAKRR